MNTYAILNDNRVVSIIKAATQLAPDMLLCPTDTKVGWIHQAGLFTPATASAKKLHGVLIDGVMCSATSEDQIGLMAVLVAYQLQGDAFVPTNFCFSNGNHLALTKDNVTGFIAAWLPFRQNFFTG